MLNEMEENNPIRILHVLGGTGLGGAESRIMDLYRQMDRAEIQFDFLVHDGDVRGAKYDTRVINKQFYDAEIFELGGHIYELPKFYGYNIFSYKKAIRAFFADHHEFQVVQGHMTSTASLYLPEAKKAGVPMTAAHARNAGVEHGAKGWLTRMLRKNLSEKADFLFACSSLAGEDVFGKESMEEGRVRIIHNAIDAGRFVFNPEIRKQVRDELELSDDRLVLGHVGRFHPQKNHDFLIDIFAALSVKRPDAVLLLLGEGEGMDAIREKCKSLGLEDRVRFLGNQKYPERYYQAFDAFLLPSLYEGLPGVLVEAQAAGLPCFVSDTVTREAQATDEVYYLPIDGAAPVWAEEILAHTGAPRQNTTALLQKAGFDVRAQVEGYRQFYLHGDDSKL